MKKRPLFSSIFPRGGVQASCANVFTGARSSHDHDKDARSAARRSFVVSGRFEPPPGEREGAAKIIHKADVVPASSTNSPARGGLWPLYSSPEARLNYFAVTAPTSLHFHPDADHRLYVLEGKVVVTCGSTTTTNSVGDFIVIPRGVRHSYNVAASGERALLLTFDAPPYDPAKTVNINSTNCVSR